MPPWLLFLPPPLVAVHLKILHLIFWSYLTPQCAQCALLHSTRAHEGSSAGFLFFLNPGPSLWQLSAVVSPDSPCWMCSALSSFVHIKLEVSSGKQYFWVMDISWLYTSPVSQCKALQPNFYEWPEGNTLIQTSVYLADW
jgi:hypothetical protein